jgi:EmrB/QacA subfamily drug resistance transporter
MSRIEKREEQPDGTAITGPGAEGAPGPDAAGARRWWAVAAIAMGVLVVGLDLTVLTLALPTISVDLRASNSELQWITDAYILVLAAGILPAGMLGDRYGRKKLLIGSVALFGVSSVACAYASSTGELIAARALLGVGAAAVFPLSLSIIPVLFEPEERQKAVTFIASATMLSFPIGPIVGGYLLNHFWWGSVFLINVPVVVLCITAVVFLLPESRSETRPRIDLLGVLLSAAGLVALTYGLIKAGEDGWSDAVVSVAIAAGLVILAAFVLWQRRAAAPLVDLSLFRSRGFLWGTVLAGLVSLAMFGLLFAMPQYFQHVKGTDPMGAGIRLLPMIGGMLVGMSVGTRLQTPRKDGTPPALSARVAIAIGFVLMAAGIAMGAATSVSTGTGFTMTWFVVAGAGLGIAMPSSMTTALSALSAERSGTGSAVLTALRQVGATLGVAVLGTVLSNGYTSDLRVPAAIEEQAGQSVGAGVAIAGRLRSPEVLENVRSAFVHGMDLMLITGAAIALASAVLALIFIPGRTGEESDET